MSRARETTLGLLIMYICPLKLISCAAHNSRTLLDKLVIFDRNIYEVK